MKAVFPVILSVTLCACTSGSKSKEEVGDSPLAMQKVATPAPLGKSMTPSMAASMRTGPASMKTAAMATTMAAPPARIMAAPVAPKVEEPAIKAAPSDRLEALLKKLRAANAAGRDSDPILNKQVSFPKTEKDEGLPSGMRSRIIELRTKGGLFGALILLCEKGKKACSDRCDQAFTVKQAPGKHGELVAYVIKPEVFGGTKHRVAVSPAFADTSALLLYYDVPTKTPCSPTEEASEYADKVDRGVLLKVGKRRIVPYEYYSINIMSAEPGHSQDTSTTLGWYKGHKAGVHYLGVTRYYSERTSGTAPDIENETHATCESTTSVVVMEKGKYWRDVHGARLKALRARDTGLATLPRNWSGKDKRCTP